MQLFDIEADPKYNHLPYEGTVQYYGKVMQKLVADDYFEKLMQNIAWENDQAIIFGRQITTKRKVAWYGDQAYEYTYSNVNRYALPWTVELLELRQRVQQLTGEEGMAWHSDDETDLKKNGAIASLSFGAARKFAFKHKQSKEKVELYLEHGSLLVMKDTTQNHWLHRLPPTKKVSTARINLTFRTIVE